MRSPVGVLTKVACTMCYLSEQGRLRKTADAFGLSRSTVSVVVRKNVQIHLGGSWFKIHTAAAY